MVPLEAHHKSISEIDHGIWAESVEHIRLDQHTSFQVGAENLSRDTSIGCGDGAAAAPSERVERLVTGAQMDGGRARILKSSWLDLSTKLL